MTCNDCIHEGVCYKLENVNYDYAEKCRDFHPSRKGHWIIKDRYYYDTITAECSECGREVEILTCMSELMYNGCPYCLADMRGDIK